MTISGMGSTVRLLGLLAACLAGSAASHAAEPGCQGQPGQVRLIVVVENVRSPEGLVDVTIYPDEPQRFLKRGGPIRGLSGVTANAETPVTRMCVWLPSPGAYAISVYHDANGNHEFDQNFIGLPTEGFGFSNNPALRIGPPSFEAARFLAKGDLTITIRLRYVG